MPTTGLANQRYAVAVTCIDGRIQEALRRHIVQRYAVDYVDMVTVPGADGALAGAGDGPDAGADAGAAAGAGRGCAISGVHTSRSAHDSRVVVVAGHTDCAGNPVNETRHVRDLHRAADWLTGEFPDAFVVALLLNTDTGTILEVQSPMGVRERQG